MNQEEKYFVKLAVMVGLISFALTVLWTLLTIKVV